MFGSNFSRAHEKPWYNNWESFDVLTSSLALDRTRMNTIVPFLFLGDLFPQFS